MNETEIRNKAEALLFGLGRPLSYSELGGMLGVSENELRIALLNMHKEGAVALVDDGRVVELRVASAHSKLIEQVRKDEFSREVGRAGLEVLSAILYRGPLSRSEIDFIRGVNSSQTLRTLAMRSLVRRVPNPKDERSFLYEPTTELLSLLGVTRKEELPEYKTVKAELERLESAYRTQEG